MTVHVLKVASGSGTSTGPGLVDPRLFWCFCGFWLLLLPLLSGTNKKARVFCREPHAVASVAVGVSQTAGAHPLSPPQPRCHDAAAGGSRAAAPDPPHSGRGRGAPSREYLGAQKPSVTARLVLLLTTCHVLEHTSAHAAAPKHVVKHVLLQI